MMESQYQSNRIKYNLDNQFLVDSSTPIYKYLSFFQLVDILERKKLFLQKVCYWDDPSEGNGYMHAVQDSIIKMIGENGDIVKETLSKYKDTIKSEYPFGTSWSLLMESDAMWRIYSQDKMAVQIQTSVEKLENTLTMLEFPKKYSVMESYFDIKYTVGKVNYAPADNRNDIENDTEQFEHFLIKREAFKHEEEIRGLVKFSVTTDDDSHRRLLQQKPLSRNISYFQLEEKMSYAPIKDDFIEAVRIDPRADNWIAETIKKYCESKNISNVKRSDLYGK